MTDIIPFRRKAAVPDISPGFRRLRIKVACQNAAARTENPFFKMLWLVKARQAGYLPSDQLRPVAATPRVDFTP